MNKPKYITNKDLLREIHRSKASFCYSQSPEYMDFDVIVSDKGLITPELIERTLQRKLNPKGKNAAPAQAYTAEDVVVRVMTHEHVPLDPDRKRKARNTDQSYARTNFPPFKHYVVREGECVEVARSHWKGDLANGTFCLDKGKLSNNLAVMFMLLVERYSRRGNWRGYCVDTETEALTKRGWLRWDQITEQDTILSYDQGQLKWSRIKSIFRDHYSGNMFRLTVSGMDALVTPGHKFVTQDGLKPVEYLLETDHVIMTGEAAPSPEDAVYSDDFVRLVGWVITEGAIYRPEDRNYPRIDVYQNDGPHAEEIRQTLRALRVRYSEKQHKGSRCFVLTKAINQQIAAVLSERGNKVPSLGFINALTQSQRMLLIDTMVKADGWDRAVSRSYCQKCKDHVDAFVMLCTLAGLRTSVKHRDIVSYGKPSAIYTVTIFSNRFNHSRVENIDFHGGKRNGKIKGRGKINHPNEPTEPYRGMVWCPETEYGSFMCRRNGYVYLTGNTYVDEMRSFALMQLSQVGLQFDEAKSDNPFAFYTTVIKNSFTRILNVERRNQNIRDDMLIVAGVAPSYTRQIENEMEYRFPADPAAPKKRGAPKRKPPATAQAPTPTAPIK